LGLFELRQPVGQPLHLPLNLTVLGLLQGCVAQTGGRADKVMRDPLLHNDWHFLDNLLHHDLPLDAFHAWRGKDRDRIQDDESCESDSSHG
jgi:hypothetical protein